MHYSVTILVISGLEDGTEFRLHSIKGDGKLHTDSWSILIGRQENCDVRLLYDSYVSRQHAKLHFKDSSWWLQDLDSRNGSFLPFTHDFFEDERVHNTRAIQPNQLFRIGRTWLRLKQTDE